MAVNGPLIRDEQPDEARILRDTRLRLMAVSGFVTLLILVVLGFLTYGAVSTRFAASDRDQLMGYAEERQREGPAESTLELGGSNAGIFAIFVDPSGGAHPPTDTTTIPAGLPDVASLRAATAGQDGTDFRRVTGADGTPYDIYTLTDQTVLIRVTGARAQVVTGWTVQYVANRSAEASLLGTLRLILLGGGLLALLAALAAGYLYAGRALVPIRDSIERRRLALQRQREFTANASHELRTPLTVIRASVEDLRRNRRARVEEVGEALEDIDAEVNHLTALVEDLLLLARTDSGVVQLDRRPVDLADSAAEAVSLLSPLAQRQRVSVLLDPLPAPLEGDPLRLRQLVTILLDNAVRHSPTGSEVRVRVRPEPATATLVVEDEGPGIRPQDMPRLFERFWRADNAPVGGTGLGLAIAHWIVEQHGGTIAAENCDGGGARFSVRLPAGSSVAPFDMVGDAEAGTVGAAPVARPGAPEWAPPGPGGAPEAAPGPWQRPEAPGSDDRFRGASPTMLGGDEVAGPPDDEPDPHTAHEPANETPMRTR